jgi:thiamine kinase-like enzyme
LKERVIIIEEHYDALKKALAKMFGQEIKAASYSCKQLKAEITGNVQLVSGLVDFLDGKSQPYQLVLKRLDAWERYGDPMSWRREYDLYKTDLEEVFEESFSWAKCYHQEQRGEALYVWMEYLSGVTGWDMSLDMFEDASRALGRFQGRLYAKSHQQVKELENLSQKDLIKKTYYRYRNWDQVYDYIRSSQCDLPENICQMLIENDQKAETIWAGIEGLPVVLCHRDYWVTNIFCEDHAVRTIDWDTSGWGYLGEDIASLIADETDPKLIQAYYEKCVPAYYEGLSEHMDVSHIEKSWIKEMILMMYGYRLVEWYKFSESQEDKAFHLSVLENIYGLYE